jgi:LPXTG-motif cell wall-anchored protein
MRRRAAIGTAIGAAIVLTLAASEPATAATPPVGSFPVWTQTSPTAFSGQFSAAAGGGAIGVTTTASNARVAETGTASFLGAQTGFGQRFGTSRYQSYLTIGLAPALPGVGHGADSVTTVTLPTLPAGWGFAVGDIDADMVSIDATGPGGALTAAQLGPQDTSGTPILNYCANASPKPSSCGAGTSFTDAPWWCATTGGGVCAPATRPRTVVGNGADTQGAYDWFVPTVGVTSLTLTYQWLTGIPSFQLWIVTPAPAAVVSGKILQPSGAPASAGTTVALEDAAGTPVPDIQNQPVSVPVAADGTFSLTTELGSYQLAITVPEGFATPPPIRFTASGDTVQLPTLALTAVLPATGTDAGPLFLAAGGLLGLGLLLSAGAVLLRRRRTPTR